MARVLSLLNRMWYNEENYLPYTGMENYWNSDGTSPIDEEGVSVSQGLRAMKREALRFHAAILNHSPIPEGCRAELMIRENPHDFGNYLDLIAIADPEDEEAVQWAMDLENLPMTWKELEETTNHDPFLEAAAERLLDSDPKNLDLCCV